MKTACLLSLLVVSAIVYAEGRSSRHRRHGEGGMKSVMKECAEENGKSKEEIRELFRRIKEGDEEALTEMGCVNACVMEKMGTLNGNEINEEKVKEFMRKRIEDEPEKEAEVMEKLDECMNKVKDISDQCELAGKFFKCAHPIWHRRRHE